MRRSPAVLKRAGLFLAVVGLLVVTGRAAVAVPEQLFFTNFDGTVSGWEWHEHVTGTTAHWGMIAGMGQPVYSGQADIYFVASTATPGDSVRISRQDPIALNRYTELFVQFAIYHETSSPGVNDRVQVQVSTDNGGTWNNAGDAIPRYNGATGWQIIQVNLDGYDHASSLRFGFLGTAAHGSDIYIDDVGLYGTLTPFEPSEGTVGNQVTL